MRKFEYIFILLFLAVQASAQAPPDSVKSRKDSLAKTIVPRTFLFDPLNMVRQQNHLRTQDPQPFDLIVHDPMDTLPGYSQSLGIIGQPYRRWLNGMPSVWFPSGLWEDPVTRQEDVNVQNPENAARFFDTRTPWVNLLYYQHPGTNSAKMNRVFVNATQNIGPLMNAAFGIQRIYLPQLYAQQSTAIYNLYASYRIRSLNDRYHAFVSGVYNNNINTFSGGLINSDQQALDGSVYSDIDGVVTLSGVKFTRIVKGLSMRHVYRFFNDSTTSPHHFLVAVNGSAQYFLKHFGDPSIRSFPKNSFEQAVYPTLNPVPDAVKGYSLEEHITGDVWKMSGEGSWSYEKKKFRHMLLAGADQSYTNFRQDSTTVKQDMRSGFHAEGNFSWLGKEARLNGRFSSFGSGGSLLGPEMFVRAELEAESGMPVFDYVRVDSVNLKSGEDFWYDFEYHRPVKISFAYQTYTRHPSYFQTFYRPGWQNTYRPNGDLVSPKMDHFSFSVSREGKRPLRGKQMLNANAIGLRIFSTYCERFIYPDAQMHYVQAPAGQPVAWTGGDIHFHLRLFKKFNLDNRTLLQFPSVSDTTSAYFTLYGKSLPAWSGVFKAYYESKDIPIADYFCIGGALYYYGAYEGLVFDPLSQDFYPGSSQFLTPAYLEGYPYTSAFQFFGSYMRIDLYTMVKLKSATLYARMIHANEKLSGYQAYFTTPYYPMLKRALLFGVNWNFLN